MEKTDEALAVYQHLLQLNPNLAAAHCNIGAIWQLQGKNREAIAYYQQALNIAMQTWGEEHTQYENDSKSTTIRCCLNRQKKKS